jgi:hypothetical protein
MLSLVGVSPILVRQSALLPGYEWQAIITAPIDLAEDQLLTSGIALIIL